MYSLTDIDFNFSFVYTSRNTNKNVRLWFVEKRSVRKQSQQQSQKTLHQVMMQKLNLVSFIVATAAQAMVLNTAGNYAIFAKTGILFVLKFSPRSSPATSASSPARPPP